MDNPNAPVGQKKDIQDTLELVVCAARCWKRFAVINTDGKISWKENLSWAAEAPYVIEAVKGITDVPAEMADISQEEYDTLVVAFKTEAGEALPDDERALVIMDEVYKMLRALVAVMNNIRNILTPPKAEPLP